MEARAGGVAVAVGDGGAIYRSTDSGATWASIASGTTQPLLAIEGTDHGRMYAVGSSGTVLRSDDDGSTWTVRSSPSGATLSDVAVADRDVLWVAGGGGEIHRSSDGGATWTNQSSGTTLAIESIDAYDGTRAIATTTLDGAMQGRVLRTFDGGATWSAATHPVGDYLYDVRYLDATHVVISGNTVYRRSIDGGSAWTQHSTGLSNLFAIAPLDPNSFVLAGQGDVVTSVVPKDPFDDYAVGSRDFSTAPSTFGACLQTATAVTATSWPVAGIGNCTGAQLTNWRGIAATAGDSTALVASTASGSTGVLTFRFGAKPGSSQPPGNYTAAIRFEVTAP